MLDPHVRWLVPPEDQESAVSVAAWLRARREDRGVYLDLAQRGWDGEELARSRTLPSYLTVFASPNAGGSRGLRSE